MTTEVQLLDYLKSRRTIPLAQFTEPGPDAKALRAILEIAARVPDHGKLAPWRFIVYGREDRAEAVQGLIRIAEQHPDEKERRIRSEKTAGFAQSPLVIGVVFAPIADHPKIPLWEQQLSAGAACLNLIHAAQAHGFAAQWLTGWFAYDRQALSWLGLADGERIAGFIHIGTPTETGLAFPGRDRPDVGKLISEWRPSAP